jgi:hypothetical protein
MRTDVTVVACLVEQNNLSPGPSPNNNVFHVHTLHNIVHAVMRCCAWCGGELHIYTHSLVVNTQPYEFQIPQNGHGVHNHVCHDTRTDPRAVSSSA